MDVCASHRITGHPGRERCSCPPCVRTRNRSRDGKKPSGRRYIAHVAVAISVGTPRAERSALRRLARLNSAAFDRYRGALVSAAGHGGRSRGILGRLVLWENCLQGEMFVSRTGTRLYSTKDVSSRRSSPSPVLVCRSLSLGSLARLRYCTSNTYSLARKRVTLAHVQ
jgi:hypothetical protein